MVLYNGNAEVVGNFRALNFYKSSDINIKEDIRLLVEGTLKVSGRTRSHFCFKHNTARYGTDTCHIQTRTVATLFFKSMESTTSSRKECIQTRTDDLSGTLHNKWRVLFLKLFSSSMVSLFDIDRLETRIILTAVSCRYSSCRL
jgi:hypothetical protein